MNDIGSEKVNNEALPEKKRGLGLRAKLAMIFIAVMLIPVVILTIITWNQITTLGFLLREISVSDATTALNDSALENLERMTTNRARTIADFLHHRDQDILLLANLIPSDEAYREFSVNRNSNLLTMGDWALSEDKMSWVEVNPYEHDAAIGMSSNRENNDDFLGRGFNYRPPEYFEHYQKLFPLYDEITYIDLNGQELFKYVDPGTTKINYPMNPEKTDVSDRLNTYVKAETYWKQLKKLQPGEIYVSDVIGAYVGTNYIGMYTPGVLSNNVPRTHPNYEDLQKISNLPFDEFLETAKKQAFAGKENPFGQRFEGVVRWATPVVDGEGEIRGYVTMALNHDHIMEFVNYITPMRERYTALPNAYDGNYAFIWDYKCRNIAHPRHHSIVGYNPLTGEPQVPWLEGTIKLQRDFINGGFVLDENRRSIPVLDSDGKTELAADSPFYVWYINGGKEWLAANPTWNELSAGSNLSAGNEGVSWGEFYEDNKDNRELLPQFGERPLRDAGGDLILDENGNIILDYQSRRKTPARDLTEAGFVGLDGRYLNNAPQCTGWMDLTENGGSGSFYILWSDLYKPSAAGTIPYYTGKYSPEVQGNRRGFAFVTIGSGIEDFTEPAVLMEYRLIGTINTNLRDNVEQLIITSIATFIIIIIVVMLAVSSVTGRIKQLVTGIYRFRTGEMQYRVNSTSTDELGILADSFDEMADSIEHSITDLEDARQKAEMASEAKSNFLSNMSHEIRTPLNAIMGMTSIGTASDDIEKKNYALEKVYEASRHLLGIINDILDVSKIEANKFTLSPAKFSINKLVEQVIDVINHRIEQKRQKLSVHIDSGIPDVLLGDDQRLMQVIMNLLSNAVKFTAEQGTITLDVKTEKEESDYCTLLVAVTDSGIGISEEQQQRLFLPFEQAEASTSRRFGGTGLGLVICKSIVEMMGGNIWVESEFGKGTIVSFTARLAYDNKRKKKDPSNETSSGSAEPFIPDDEPDARSVDFSGFTVLLAEDVEINREIVIALLEPTKLNIDCAKNGVEAVDAYLSNPAKYDLILMDIQMPEMDGYTAAQAIRDSGVPRSGDIPIVAMTANAFKEDIEKCLESGMDGHIGKPLILDVFIETLKEYLK